MNRGDKSDVGQGRLPMKSASENLGRFLAALAQAGRVLTGRQIAGRNSTVFADDVFLVSYPRSGNTWLRFLLGNLIDTETPVTFSNLESRIPEIYFNRDRSLRALPRPRMLKSHESFQPHYPRVIYLVRDPRDVAVSYYHHNVKARNIAGDYSMEKFVPRFIAGEFDRKFGTWRDNALSWLAARGEDPTFFMIRYEDLQSDLEGTLGKIGRFLERCNFRPIVSDAAARRRAIELSSPDRMRALEAQQSKDWVLTKHTRADKPFVRTAIVGAWKSQLPAESAKAIESAWGDQMRRLGYELTEQRPAAASGRGEIFS
jgi:hypothetical protein